MLWTFSFTCLMTGSGLPDSQEVEDYMIATWSAKPKRPPHVEAKEEKGLLILPMPNFHWQDLSSIWVLKKSEKKNPNIMYIMKH